MPRFFIAASNIFGGVAYINGKDTEHIRALRIKRGEEFIMCDGAGTDYSCRLIDFSPEGAQVEIIDKSPSSSEPTVNCSVFIAFSKSDRLETAVQKSVELGAYEIVLFQSHRCVSKPEGGALIKKVDRLQKIAEEAAKQAGRGIIPKVKTVAGFREAIDLAASAQVPLFCYEDEQKLGIREAIETRPDAKTFSVVTGPEGGFEKTESEYAMERGMLSVSMGPRILRCETAPMCALSAVMLLTGNM